MDAIAAAAEQVEGRRVYMIKADSLGCIH